MKPLMCPTDETKPFDHFLILFCKASATFIGKLSCLDMQVEGWMNGWIKEA